MRYMNIQTKRERIFILALVIIIFFVSLIVYFIYNPQQHSQLNHHIKEEHFQQLPWTEPSCVNFHEKTLFCYPKGKFIQSIFPLLREFPEYLWDTYVLKIRYS